MHTEYKLCHTHTHFAQFLNILLYKLVTCCLVSWLLMLCQVDASHMLPSQLVTYAMPSRCSPHHRLTIELLLSQVFFLFFVMFTGQLFTDFNSISGDSIELY